MSPAVDPFATLAVEQTSTVERVAEELRRAIFDGELAARTPLRELALVQSLKVSRSTVREALTRLVADGLATREPHRGVTVAAPAAESVRDVCRSRLVLEGAGVQGWPQATPAQRSRVRQTLEDYRTAVASNAGYGELNERHLTFHVSLVGLTGTRRVVAMAESLMTELKVALAQVDRIRRNAHDQVEDHAELVDLLEAGDTEGAHAFLVEHLAEAERAIVSALGL